MKTTMQRAGLKLFVLFACLCSGFYSLAQDGTTSQTTVSHSESNATNPDAAMWYSNPIVWVIGGIVLLLIIIVAARSGKKTISDTEVSRTTTTTTTVKED